MLVAFPERVWGWDGVWGWGRVSLFQEPLPRQAGPPWCCSQELCHPGRMHAGAVVVVAMVDI